MGTGYPWRLMTRLFGFDRADDLYCDYLERLFYPLQKLRCRLWIRGHDWYPDICGRVEHDMCSRCMKRRGSS